MTTIIANKQARRRGVVFAILIATTLLLMAFSGNPFVQDLQRGLSFALRPFQGAIAGGRGRDGRASPGPSRRSTSSAPTTPTLRAENERLANENARLRALKQENDDMAALLQLQSGFDHGRSPCGSSDARCSRRGGS